MIRVVGDRNAEVGSPMPVASDAGGRFAVALPAGRYRVRPGAAPVGAKWGPSWFAPATGETLAAELTGEVRAGEAGEPVVFTLSKAEEEENDGFPR